MKESHMPRKPALTDKVLRGLKQLAVNAPLVDVLNGTATLDEITGYANRSDLDDAKRAADWIDGMIDYRAAKQKEARA